MSTCVLPPQVIEKAYKKLRLDALVIQQGRLTEGAKGAKVCGQYQDCFDTTLHVCWLQPVIDRTSCRTSSAAFK